MKIRLRKRNGGFTLLELVVAISILGIMIGGSIVRYSKVTRRAQMEQNRANILVIREAFFQYYYRNHMDGNPHFPPAPQDTSGLMNNEWASTPIDSTISVLTPNDLFVTREVPKNNVKNPFFYGNYTELDTLTNELRYYIVIKDLDYDSPTYQESYEFSI